MGRRNLEAPKSSSATTAVIVLALAGSFGAFHLWKAQAPPRRLVSGDPTILWEHATEALNASRSRAGVVGNVTGLAEPAAPCEILERVTLEGTTFYRVRTTGTDLASSDARLRQFMAEKRDPSDLPEADKRIVRIKMGLLRDPSTMSAAHDAQLKSDLTALPNRSTIEGWTRWVAD